MNTVPQALSMQLDKYVLITWPDSQFLMEQEWFDECFLMNDENHLDSIGSAAYFVPYHRYEALTGDEEGDEPAEDDEDYEHIDDDIEIEEDDEDLDEEDLDEEDFWRKRI